MDLSKEEIKMILQIVRFELGMENDEEQREIYSLLETHALLEILKGE